MNKREATIVSAYTGYLIGIFSELQKYATEKLNRPILSHEFAFIEVTDKLKEKSKQDFINIQVEEEN